jgi:preprotein translocase subunit SecG
MEGVKISNGEGYICKDVDCPEPPCGVVPVSCGDISNKAQCEQEEIVIKDGNVLDCVWIIDISNVGNCFAKHGGAECQYYTSEVGCTWTISGLLCVWSGEGCSMIKSCSDINDTKKCSDSSSAKGKCFSNADACQNVEDIYYCDQLFTLILCNNGNTNIYPKLQNNNINEYPCKWDPTLQICQSRVTENEKDIPIPVQEKSDTVVIIVIVVVVVVVVVVSIIVVVVILLRRRDKIKNSQLNSSVDPKTSEMESLRLDSSSNQNKKRKTGINFIIFLLIFFTVKGENANNEYSVGDVIGEYEIKGTVGRGFINYFFFRNFN